MLCLLKQCFDCPTQVASPIGTVTPLHLAPVNMSSSFDELEEDEQDELEAKEKHAVSGAHCSTRMPLGQSGEAASAVALTGPSSDGFLPTLTKKTTSRLCHWVSSNWSSRGANFSSIDVRECLPPIYHNTKNIVKTIKVGWFGCFDGCHGGARVAGPFLKLVTGLGHAS